MLSKIREGYTIRIALPEECGGGADKKLDSLRAPKGVGLQCIHKIKLTLHYRSTTSAVP